MTQSWYQKEVEMMELSPLWMLLQNENAELLEAVRSKNLKVVCKG